MEKTTYPQLDYSSIQENFPMSVEKIIEWFCTREDIVQGVLRDQGEVRMDQLKELMGKVVPMIIQHDPRKLYEFFDDKNIIIYISPHPDSRERFVYFNSKTGLSKGAETRIEAEIGAFLDAFTVLEKELNG